MKTKLSEVSVQQVYAVILLLVFGLIVLHAPLIVWVGSTFPDLTIAIKAWKEVLIVIASFIAIYLLFKLPHARKAISHDLFVWLAGLYILLHVCLSGFYWGGWHAYAEGLMVDTRYIIFALLVYFAIKIQPQRRRQFLIVGILGAIFVCLFAVLQVTVLPRDILANIGYSKETIPAYMTVDQNTDYIRINSTLRGPNPLGAYAIIVLGLVSAYIGSHFQALRQKRSFYYISGLSLLLLASGVALWASYSRSALVGGALALAIVIGVFVVRKAPRIFWIGFVSFAIIGFSTVYTFRHTSFVSNVVLHENPTSQVELSSNEGHAESLKDGFDRMLRQPLGAGIGSTGSASYYSDRYDTLYIENQYLHIAHESGWLGLGLFLWLFGLIIGRLWHLKQDWVALGIMASGIGIAIVGLLLPVWVDDTVSLVWWGFAGMVLAGTKPKVGASSLLHRFVKINRKWSAFFDRIFIPAKWRQDGLALYCQETLPPLVDRSKVIYDIGGGKRPYVGTVYHAPDKKIIGLDIDQQELERAPVDAYYKTIVGDIGAKNLKIERPYADLVICQVVLEHVFDNKQAIKNIFNFTKKGGVVALFVPSRNALFAQINLVLPEKLKLKLLHGVFPESAHAQGFPAYYHDCTPNKMAELMKQSGFKIERISYYFQGTYFTFFLPLHILWRLYQSIAYLFVRNNAADYYCIIATKD